MKNFILIIFALCTMNALASEKFSKCDSSDLRLLEVAHSRHHSVKDVVMQELLANPESCMVSKPRYVHPAVCGTTISQVDTFQFMTDRSARFEAVVDHSYISCQRTRALIIPKITSLKFNDLPILPHM